MGRLLRRGRLAIMVQAPCSIDKCRQRVWRSAGVPADHEALDRQKRRKQMSRLTPLGKAA